MILYTFYSKIVKYSLTNTFLYKRPNKLPKFKKITLNINIQIIETKKLFSILLALELIAKQKVALNIKKKTFLKIQFKKGNSVSCKLPLQKQNLHKFCTGFILKILPKSKNITTRNLKQKSLFFEINDSLNFSELKKHYYFFNNLPKFRIILSISTKKKKQLVFFLKLFQIIY